MSSQLSDHPVFSHTHNIHIEHSIFNTASGNIYNNIVQSGEAGAFTIFNNQLAFINNNL